MPASGLRQSVPLTVQATVQDGTVTLSGTVARLHQKWEAEHGQLRERRVRTLREFVAEIESVPPASLTEYLVRRDFSRWIGDIFGDRTLAADVARLETRDHASARPETAALIADAVRGRYDLTDTEWERGMPVPAAPAAQLRVATAGGAS